MLTYANHLDLLLKWPSLLPAAVHQTGQTSPIVLVGWGTRIPAQTRVGDQKPLSCSAFLSSHGGRVGALWTMPVDHSSRRGMAGTPTPPWAARPGWPPDSILLKLVD